MADMTPTESEGGQGPEGQLNTQSEREPNSVVTFVYRKNIPMRELAEGLKQRGETVVIKEIEDSDYQAVLANLGPEPTYPERNKDENRDEFSHRIDQYNEQSRTYGNKKNVAVGHLIGDLSGVVISDETLVVPSAKLIGFAPIVPTRLFREAYWRNEDDMVKDLAPINEQIRAAGKIPIAFSDHLGDHFASTIYKEALGLTEDGSFGAPFEEATNRYADFLKRHFDIDTTMSSDLTNAVWLVDHHALDRNAGLQKSSEIVLACPCCAMTDLSGEGNKSRKMYQENHKKYNFFPIKGLTTKERLGRILPLIQKAIEETREKGLIAEPKSETLNQVGNNSEESNDVTTPLKPALEAKPQAEKEQISFLRRALSRFGGKK